MFNFTHTKVYFTLTILVALQVLAVMGNDLVAQDTTFKSKHAAIIFPYPMYKEKVRASIGFTLLTTPEDITEEVRLRIPAGDFHMLTKLNNHFLIETRIAFQILQNHISAGIRWVKPLRSNLYFSAGDDMGYWFGFLKAEGFNTKGHGWLNYPNASLGYRTKKNMLITLRGQVSINMFYKSTIGKESVSSGNYFYNGETFTLSLEQPFYGRKHLTLAFSAINNYFYWQTWALFYKTDRKIFYPQITVGFIL